MNLLKWSALALLVIVACGRTCAQDAQTLYVSGQFPPGRVYTESELNVLIGQPLPNPSYLVGRFLFLGERNGTNVFSNFTRKSGDIVFGKTLLAVRFFNNVPPNLRVGTEINATIAAPLTIKAVVGRSTEGLLLVKTECWVAP